MVLQHFCKLFFSLNKVETVTYSLLVSSTLKTQHVSASARSSPVALSPWPPPPLVCNQYPSSQNVNLSLIGKGVHKHLLLKLHTLYQVFLGSKPIWYVTDSLQNNQTSSSKVWLCGSRCIFRLLSFLGDFGRFL